MQHRDLLDRKLPNNTPLPVPTNTPTESRQWCLKRSDKPFLCSVHRELCETKTGMKRNSMHLLV